MWLIWLGIAVVAVIAEVVSLQFVLLMVAVGSLAGAAADAFGIALPGQIMIAAVVTAASLVLARPRLLAWARRTPLATTNIASLVGRQATTLTEVTEAGGRVRIGGDEWSARTAAPEDVYPPDIHVIIRAIDGVTAVVGTPKGNS